MTQTSLAPHLSTGDSPLPGATFGQAVSRFYGRYSTFSGRASRSEYWWVSLYFGIVMAIGAVVAGVSAAAATVPGAAAEPSPFTTLVLVVLFFFLAASFVPSLALNARRLHDAGFSGWLQLVCLIPSVGSLVMMALALLPSSAEGARYDRYHPPTSLYGG